MRATPKPGVARALSVIEVVRGLRISVLSGPLFLAEAAWVSATYSE